MLRDNLVKLGLTNNEAGAYIYLLNNHKAKASEIARHLNVTHPAAKKILDSLLGKKIIRSQEYSKTTFYFPEEGINIIQFIDQESITVKEKQSRKKELALQTSKLIDSKIFLREDPQLDLKFLKGKEGIQELTQMIFLAKDKQMYEFVDTELQLYTKQKDNINYLKEYQSRKIKWDIIYTNKDFEPQVESEMIKLLPDEVDLPAAQMLIFDDKVAFSFISDDHTIMLIQNYWIANTLRTLFKNLKKCKLKNASQ